MSFGFVSHGPEISFLGWANHLSIKEKVEGARNSTQNKAG